MTKKLLESHFRVIAPAMVALTLSFHSVEAMDAGACIDQSQINGILTKEGQSKIIEAVQSPWMVEEKAGNIIPVGNFMDVTFTSGAAGKTGYQLSEDGCKPLATDGSTGRASVGIRVSSLLRDIHTFEKSSGIPPEARMDVPDPEAALKDCDVRLANLAKKGMNSRVCGLHNKILGFEESIGLHVIFQAKGSSKGDFRTPTVVTVFAGDPQKDSDGNVKVRGVVTWTSPSGAAFLAGIFSSVSAIGTP
jgi:hypothetical protein